MRVKKNDSFPPSVKKILLAAIIISGWIYLPQVINHGGKDWRCWRNICPLPPTGRADYPERWRVLTLLPRWHANHFLFSFPSAASPRVLFSWMLFLITTNSHAKWRSQLKKSQLASANANDSLVVQTQNEKKTHTRTHTQKKRGGNMNINAWSTCWNNVKPYLGTHLTTGSIQVGAAEMNSSENIFIIRRVFFIMTKLSTKRLCNATTLPLHKRIYAKVSSFRRRNWRILKLWKIFAKKTKNKIKASAGTL